MFIVNVAEYKPEPNQRNDDSVNVSLQWSECEIEDCISKLPYEAKKLVVEYKTLFPNELPKELPPRRTIEHRIDLIPGAQPTNHSIYRMSDHELKELKKQLDDLLAHGFIPKSESFR